MEIKNNKKVIFIDLDGTLMTKGFKISQENIDAINLAIKNDIDIVLLSGRPYKLVDYLAQKINKSIKAIGFNGAYSKNLISKTINQELLKEILPFLINHSQLIMLKSNDCIYANVKPLETFVYPTSDTEKVEVVVTNELLEEVADKEIYKILCVYRNLVDEKEIINYLEYKKLTFSAYPGRGCELVGPGVDKGFAVKEYLRYFGIELKNAYFIGDDTNDVPMFKLGGNNIVMQNGSEECKKYASFICPSVFENGVAFAIKKIIKEKQ